MLDESGITWMLFLDKSPTTLHNHFLNKSIQGFQSIVHGSYGNLQLGCNLVSLIPSRDQLLYEKSSNLSVFGHMSDIPAFMSLIL